MYIKHNGGALPHLLAPPCRGSCRRLRGSLPPMSIDNNGTQRINLSCSHAQP